jgi:hypothetical protein
VAFAIIGGSPTRTRAGKVINVPPPAIELRMPPKNPAKKRKGNSKYISLFPNLIFYNILNFYKNYRW